MTQRKDIILWFVFFAAFCCNISAQNTITLRICDSMPPDFYKKDFHEISINNGMGYCRSYTKTLDHRIKKFKNLKKLFYYSGRYGMTKNFKILPKEVSKLTLLTSLSTNAFNDEVFKMAQITHLSLNVAHGYEILERNGFGQMKGLERLELSFFELDSSMKILGISDLADLRYVSLHQPNQNIIDEVLKNPFIETLVITSSTHLNLDFSKTTELKHLILNIANLSSFPETIFDLKDLLTLKVSGNIFELSQRIGELKKLKKLDLSGNQFIGLPKEIGELKQLEHLNLHGNKLQQLPASLGTCTSLATLTLYNNNNLSAFPNSLGQLKQLKTLSAGNCGIKSLPKSLSNCIRLEAIDLLNNKLTNIDIDFSKLALLKKIKLERNLLTQVPQSLFELKELTHLNISRNKLTHLPQSIGKMESLTHLIITYNNIVTLPSDIGDLKQLKMISAYSNRIEAIPASTMKLVNLTSLHLSNNNISFFPSGFNKLTSLSELEIHNNPLKIFPTDIYELHQLKVFLSPKYKQLAGCKSSHSGFMIIFTD